MISCDCTWDAKLVSGSTSERAVMRTSACASKTFGPCRWRCLLSGSGKTNLYGRHAARSCLPGATVTYPARSDAVSISTRRQACSRRRLPSAAVPVGCIGNIAFLAVQIGVNPCRCRIRFIGLHTLVRPFPVALSIPPSAWRAKLRFGGVGCGERPIGLPDSRGPGGGRANRFPFNEPGRPPSSALSRTRHHDLAR